jgi:hypothetical protein
MLDTYTIVLVAVAVTSIAVHEGLHYVVARAVGAYAKPTYIWGRFWPNPAIETRLQDHTPRTYRAVCLAPLVAFLPGVAVAIALAWQAPSSDAVGWAAMWCFGTVPSPPDWEQAYFASDLDLLHEGWFGDHPSHAAAEGI